MSEHIAEKDAGVAMSLSKGHSADKDAPYGPQAEAQDFTCPRCRRVGGRAGVDLDDWVPVGPLLICEACVLPPAE